MAAPMTFRSMRHDEAELLNQMTLDGVRYWGHHETHPEAVAGLTASLPDADGYAAMRVRVLDDREGALGFYSLVDRGDHVELLQMFLRPDLIGAGYGRLLWNDAVTEAAASADRMLIMSDPRSIGFYQAMGAELERRVEVSPGFELGVMWVDLPSG